MNNKTTIIFITPEFGYNDNGPDIFAQYIWEYFKNQKNIRFIIICNNSKIKNKNIIQVNYKKNKGILSSFFYYKKLCIKSIEIAIKYNNVIIHSNNAFSSLFLIKYKNRFIGNINDVDAIYAKKNIKINITNYGFRRALSLLGRHIFEKQIVKRQIITICNSKYTKKSLIEVYNPGNRKILILYKGVDRKLFNKNRKNDKGKKKNSLYTVAFIGRNWKQKGLINLISSLKLAKFKIRLICIGVTYNKKLNKIFRNTENIEYSIFPKLNRLEIKKYLSQSDIFCLPSLSEAFGVSILEAMSLGIPVIASNIGGIPEIIKNNYNGILINPHDTNSILKGILKVRLNNKFSKKIVYNSMFTAKKYDKINMLKKLEKIYNSIL